MPTLVSFNGKKTLKSALVAEIKKHRKADQIVQGTYGELDRNGDWRGCAVGCAIHSLNIRMKTDWYTGDHSVYEKELGIPQIIARLEDRIFEGLPVEKAKDFPLRFMQAVPVKADLSGVFPRMMIFILNDCRQYARDDGKAAIDQCIALFERQIAGGSVTTDEWNAARAAAYAADAAAYAADAAAYAADAAAYAAYAADAADAAAYAADAAAYAADAAAYAADAAAYAARAAAFERYANELIRLLKEAPVIA